MRRFRFALAVALALAIATGVLLGATTRASAGKVDRVVVAPGAMVQIAVTVSNEFGPSYPQGIGNAVAMAVAMHPTIRGPDSEHERQYLPGPRRCGGGRRHRRLQNTGVIGRRRRRRPAVTRVRDRHDLGSATADDLRRSRDGRSDADGRPDGSGTRGTTVIGAVRRELDQYHARPASARRRVDASLDAARC